MPCFDPRRVITKDNEIQWNLDHRMTILGESRQNIPCRTCLGCRQAKAREWSVRCFHEALCHTQDWTDPDTHIETTIPNSCFITLTYNDEHLPDSGYLRHHDFQKFMMRLRKMRGPDAPKIKHFMCGEFGEKKQRPHYHSILFGLDLDDIYETIDQNGQVQRMSYTLDKLWTQAPQKGAPPTQMGRATVDPMTFGSASYVAGYVAKKLLEPKHTGPITHSVDTSTGETKVCHPSPEYRTMSGGLGKNWILNPDNMDRTFANDYVQITEYKFGPPHFYDLVHKKKRPKAHARLVKRRQAKFHDTALEWDQKRCAAALEIAHDALHGRQQKL